MINQPTKEPAVVLHPTTKFLLTYSCRDINRNLGIFDTEKAANHFIKLLCQEEDWAEAASADDFFFIDRVIASPNPKLVRYGTVNMGWRFTKRTTRDDELRRTPR